MKILIAEDDFMSRKVLHQALKHKGECDLACNGLEALAAYTNSIEMHEPYNLILLDIMMPEMDGSEVLRKIREFEANSDGLGAERVKIVMASSLIDKNHVIDAFRNQADGYIVKPYAPESIIRDLQQCDVL